MVVNIMSIVFDFFISVIAMILDWFTTSGVVYYFLGAFLLVCVFRFVLVPVLEGKQISVFSR